MYARALPVLALVILVAGTGCVNDPANDSAGATPTPVVRAETALIAAEVLAAYVPPAPPGWQFLAPPSPVLLEEDGGTFVSVTASYISGSPNGTSGPVADLTIQDTGNRSVGLRRLVDRLALPQADGTAPVPTTLRGQPAFVFTDGPIAGAYLVVADRYVVSLAITDGTRADFDAFVAALDLEGLSEQR